MQKYATRMVAAFTSMVSVVAATHSQAQLIAQSQTMRLFGSRKGVGAKTFEKLMVATVLVLLLLVIVANFMPDLYTDINSSEFRDVPGGALVADNVTLIILGLLLVAVAIGYIKIATRGLKPRMARQ